uniref:Tetraspanin n=1 Tax=Melopsittacus undulatus TaxID=13146 RepID=A0A8C6IZX2_MELUD
MGVLSCVKYLMLIFNALVFAGGTSLVAVGLWVAVDPSGFRHIVAANRVLSAGAFLLLALGTALALLGFLGCWGALRRSRALLLGFFILVSIVFVMQLVGAVLFLLHWKQPELLLSELRRSYRGDEGAEVFSTAWNTLMVTFSCCGVLGPEDFGNGSCFQELHPGTPWPRVCCTRDGLLTRSPSGISLFQGCFSAFGRTLQHFVSLPGICSLAVLGIEDKPHSGFQARALLLLAHAAPFPLRGSTSLGGIRGTGVQLLSQSL